VATSTGLSIVDVSDPTAPSLLSQLTTDGIPQSVDVAGDIAYVSAYNSGVSVIDVSDPDEPMLLGSGWPLYDRAFDVDVSGGYVIVATERFGSVIFPEHCAESSSAGNPLPVAAPHFLGARPNPSSESSTLVFELPRASHVRLDVFDANGRLVRRVAASYLGAGTHTVPWDGRDGHGVLVASGIYWTRLEWEGGSINRPLTVVK
jgi:hypothetical protein